MPLTPKQTRFVDEYLVDLNASAAARRAGYSAKNANVTGPRLLANASISDAIAARQAALSNKTGITAERIINELAKIAFVDRRGIASLKGGKVTFKDFDELTDDQAALVEEVSQTITDAGGTIRVRLGNKVEALKLLGDHLGIFDQGEVGAPVNAQIVVEIVEVKKGESRTVEVKGAAK